MKNSSPVLSKIIIEEGQTHETRIELLKSIEEKFDIPVLSYFTSMTLPVYLDDSDADMIEGLLAKMDLEKGLMLIINSGGGLGDAAERIINICKSYSKTGEFFSLVPNKAKSAATMVCFGSSKIHMLPTAELGPIDPQIWQKVNGEDKIFAVCDLIDAYNKLFNDAVNTQGKIEPYLQQLNLFDARLIQDFERAKQLSEDIAVRALKEGMMKGQTDEKIMENIKVFLTPENKKYHGRAIFCKEAQECGLKVEIIDLSSGIANLIHELYVRTNNYVNKFALKCIETKDESFSVSIQKR
jgi:hypothetical protein